MLQQFLCSRSQRIILVRIIRNGKPCSYGILDFTPPSNAPPSNVPPADRYLQRPRGSLVRAQHEISCGYDWLKSRQATSTLQSAICNLQKIIGSRQPESTPIFYFPAPNSSRSTNHNTAVPGVACQKSHHLLSVPTLHSGAQLEEVTRQPRGACHVVHCVRSRFPTPDSRFPRCIRQARADDNRCPQPGPNMRPVTRPLHSRLAGEISMGQHCAGHSHSVLASGGEPESEEAASNRNNEMNLNIDCQGVVS